MDNKDLINDISSSLSMLNNTVKELYVGNEILQNACQLKGLTDPKQKLTSNSHLHTKINSIDDHNSIEVLKAKNLELIQQKLQLTENIKMLTRENQILLSSLKRDNDPDNIDSGKNANQNLIRSKTFTQNSPHPKLKAQVHQATPTSDSVHNSIKEHIEFEATESPLDQDNDTWELETKECMVGLLEIKQELMKQNSDLKVAMTNCTKKPKGAPTSEKPSISQKSPIMVDKMIETDMNFFTSELYELEDMCMATKKDNVTVNIEDDSESVKDQEQICPMCAAYFSKSTPYEVFTTHVTNHFIADDLKDFSIEHNLELVSHTVGNF